MRRIIILSLPLLLVAGLTVIAAPDRVEARTASASSVDPVIAAAGDIACDPTDPGFNGGNGSLTSCHEQQTSNLIVNGGYDSVLALGDEQYECGGYKAFLQSYDPAWGRFKSITHPAVGNHEYNTSGGTDCSTGAAGYFQYFGAAAGAPSEGYYSFNIGSWHLIALNSNCNKVSCAQGSPQERWLANDLAADTSTCTLAFDHHTRFSSGGTGFVTNSNLLPFWNDLYQAHADLFLAGHHHFYERMAKLDPNGDPDPNGVRQFTVGTGGINSLGTATFAFPGSQFRDDIHFGILELTLRSSGYDWRFISESGAVQDSGSDACVTGGGSPTPTLVQHAAATGSGTSPTATWGQPSTAGDLLVAEVGWSGSGQLAPSAGWNLAAKTAKTAIFYTENAASESGPVTFSLSSSGAWVMELMEWSGVAQTGALDQVATNTSGTVATTTADSGTTAVTSVSNEVAVSVLHALKDVTQSNPTNGFSQIDSAMEGTVNSTASYAKVLGATGSQQVAATLSAPAKWRGAIATFKAGP